MIYILGLLGKAGHGKSTVARHLAATRGARLVSLATPLKRAAKAILDLRDEQLWGTQAEKEAIDPRYGFSARWFLQRLGTEGLRAQFGDDIFARALLRGIERDEGGAEGDVLCVVDDLRFPNEVELIAAGGPGFRGSVIKIVCTDAPPSGQSGHASEAGIDQVPDQLLAATITSSRALGTSDLVAKIEAVLTARPATVTLPAK